MRSAVALEFDIGGGARGERDDHVRGLIRELTGAEDACVVNNNAAAVLLVLNTFGAGKEAIVSRGELIEIGGAFRLPDIMARAGARLVEVGTTNRTHLRDYEEAIGDRYRPDPEGPHLQLSDPGLHQVGVGARAFRHWRGRAACRSSTTWAPARWSILRATAWRPSRPCAKSLAEGADLVTFSGDKLLGGPQAGIVAGAQGPRPAQVAKNPMKRALRARQDPARGARSDVLKLYRDPDRLAETLPTIRYFARSKASIEQAAHRMLVATAAAVGDSFAVEIADCSSQIGSGAAPLDTLPSAGLAIAPKHKSDSSP